MTDPSPQPVPATAVAVPVPAAALAFDAVELRRSLVRPHTVLEIVLAERARLVATVCKHANLTVLVAVMVATSIAFTVPFAMVRGPQKAADIAALFLGSTGLCFPSLQVFSSYLGVRATVGQNLALALLVPSAAALFSFGFFPIYWFLEATMAEGSAVSAGTIAIGLLTVSLVLGLAHLNRCLLVDSALSGLRSNWVLLVGWQSLLVFITYRMAVALHIL
jgi:hypothetical protein